MRSYVFVSAFAAAVAAQASSNSDAYPQTSYLQQTNSLGVVTGMPAAASSQPNQPAAASSQPPLVTSLPPYITIPAVGNSGIHTITQGIPGTNQTATFTVSAANSTTAVIGAPASASGSDASGSGSGSGSATGSRSGSNPSGSGSGSNQSGSPTGSSGAAAPTMKVAGSLIGAGAFVAAFL
ncbi:hypothetical protein DM02DRAFT_649055 [Periconia macrospinosa]|uniref:GPI anchored protein n=1 Tax=Periconia macrospinosa TaxID=97972 RepID=A0A2V1E9B5_9PLEO|nr:hypothetical protein DM02DRAFT_649055 [Periconia macrospinosa]